MPNPMNRYSWNEIPEERVNPLLTRQVIHTPQVTLLRLHLKKGAVVPLHNHIHEQITTINSGTVRFELNGEEFMLEAGDVLRIPSNAPHLAEALQDSTATDLFIPARTDWIDGK